MTTEALISATTELTKTATDFREMLDESHDMLTARAEDWSNNAANYCVDQLLGDDLSDGTVEHPLASLQEAVSRVPNLSRGNIFVRGDYNMEARVDSDGRSVFLRGAKGAGFDTNLTAAERPNLNVGVSDENGTIHMLGFNAKMRSFWELSGLTINLPDLDVVVAAHPGTNTASPVHTALFARTSSGHGPVGDVHLRYCTVNIPVARFGSVLSAAHGWGYFFTNMTWNGDQTGYHHPDIPANGLPADHAHLVQTSVPSL